MSNRRRAKLLLPLLLIAALFLTSCSLLDDSEQLEERLRNSGINNLEIDLQTEILDQKLANAEPDENGVFELTFTEEEVNDMIVIRRENAAEGEAEDLQNLFIRFEDNEVLLDSDLGGVFEDVLVARFTPSAADGALQVDLREASIGPIDVPVQFLNGLESAMNSLMQAMIDSLPQANSMEAVEVNEGSLTMVVQQQQ